MAYVEDVLLTLAVHGQAMHEAAAEILGSGDLVSNASISTLMLLRSDGPQRPTRIAELTGLTSGGATKLITRLEEAGLVVRESGVVLTDGRAIVVSLTDSGREKLAEVVVVMTPHIDAMIDDFIAMRDDA